MQVSSEKMEELTAEFMPLLRSTARWFQFNFRPDDTPEECLGEVWQQFRLLVLRFDPERNQSLRGWVGAWLRRRMIDAARSYSPAHGSVQVQETGRNNGRHNGNGYRRKATRIVKRVGMPIGMAAKPQQSCKLELPVVLTKQERLVLLLRYQEGLQVAEIAALLGVCNVSVWKIHRRALDALRWHATIEV